MKTTIIAKHVAIQMGLMLSLGAVYAAWNDDVTTSDTLTATRWNDLVSQVETLGSGSVTIDDIGSGTGDWGGVTLTNASGADAYLWLAGHNYSGGKANKVILEANSDTSGLILKTNSSGGITFTTNSEIHSSVYTHAGNWGINKSTADSELDVAGTIRAEELCDETGANCSDLSSGLGGGGGGSGLGLKEFYFQETLYEISTVSPTTHQFCSGSPGGATNSSDLDGQANATYLLGLGNTPAASYCDTLVEGGHSDWFLPALYQLQALTPVIFHINPSYQGQTLWSSSWASQTNAKRMTGAFYFNNSSDANSYNVICIRQK